MRDLFLEHIDIEVNHRCNLRCRHCSARAANEPVAGELSAERIKGILAEAKAIGLRKVGLTGGEPLYDVSKTERIARFCLDELGIPIHTHTNGTLVTEELCRDGGLLALFEAVSVTFLGGDAETHDSMTRTPGSFEKAFRAAGILADAELPLTCFYIPTHGTCEGFRRLTERLCEVGARRIRAMALAPSGRARAIYGETAPRPDEMERFEKDLLAARDELGVHVEAGYCTRLSMPHLSVLAGHDRCMSGLNRVHINWRGDVFPCTAASGVKELRLGNLGGGDIASIWRDSALVNRIRQMHQGKLEACGSCARSPKCRDGCTVNACGTMSDAERKHCPLFSQDAS